MRERRLGELRRLAATPAVRSQAPDPRRGCRTFRAASRCVAASPRRAHRGRRHRRPPDARARHREPAPRRGVPTSSRCWSAPSAGIEATLLPGARLPLSSPARRTALPPPVVEEPALARYCRQAGRRLAEVFSTPSSRLAVLGTGGYASAPAVWFASTARHSHRHPGAERVSRTGHPAAFPPGGPGLPRPAGGACQAAVWSRHRGLRYRQSNSPARPRADEPRLLRASAWTRPSRRAGRCLVTGGSQGALAINEAVAAGSMREDPRRPGSPCCGPRGGGVTQRFAQLPSTANRSRCSTSSIPSPMRTAVADLVVGRAGMMTGAELCAWGLPSVLIPLPTAAEDHQRFNAEALAAAGAAVMILQRDLIAGEAGRSRRRPAGRSRSAAAAMAEAARSSRKAGCGGRNRGPSS